jgi:hypothetical protein
LGRVFRPQLRERTPRGVRRGSRSIPAKPEAALTFGQARPPLSRSGGMDAFRLTAD